jgi:hypothetical protein
LRRIIEQFGQTAEKGPIGFRILAASHKRGTTKLLSPNRSSNTTISVKKLPKGELTEELTEEQNSFNKGVSQKLVFVEHLICIRVCK